MKVEFRDWLIAEGRNGNSLNTYLYHIRSIEAAYGDLDTIYDQDQFLKLLNDLVYSAEDDRNNRQNPSKVSIGAHLYKTLASHRTVLRRYAQFRDAYDADDIIEPSDADFDLEDTSPALTFGLEKDMQQALRNNVAQLEQGLHIIDGGNERRVASGFIDILAQDNQGRTVVIELKAVKAPLKAQAQIASYMGDIAAETGEVPRGILVTPDFDPKLVAAARVVPTLSLTRYHYSFTFEPVS